MSETLKPYPQTCSELIGAGVAGDTSIRLDETQAFTFVREPIKKFGSTEMELNPQILGTFTGSKGFFAPGVEIQTKLTDTFMVPKEFIIPTTGYGAPMPFKFPIGQCDKSPNE